MTAVDQLIAASLTWAAVVSALAAASLAAVVYGAWRGLRALHRWAERGQTAGWQQSDDDIRAGMQRIDNQLAAQIAARRIPAAHDNQQGTDTTDLWTCRRIAAAGTANRKH